MLKVGGWDVPSGILNTSVVDAGSMKESGQTYMLSWLALPSATVVDNSGIEEWLLWPHWFLHMFLFLSC